MTIAYHTRYHNSPRERIRSHRMTAAQQQMSIDAQLDIWSEIHLKSLCPPIGAVPVSHINLKRVLLFHFFFVVVLFLLCFVPLRLLWWLSVIVYKFYCRPTISFHINSMFCILFRFFILLLLSQFDQKVVVAVVCVCAADVRLET